MPPRSARARPRAYHHGDLRQALVAAALELLREEGPDALTLRAVARATGVSQAAPYRHFADRRALVAAVAEDGFRRLHAAMMRAVRDAPRPARGSAAADAAKGARTTALRQLAVGYARFAHEHPAEYRIMFGSEAARPDADSPLQAASRAVFDLLRGGIAELQRAGVIRDDQDAEDIAMGAWAMMHGLVMLSLDGQTAGRSVDQLVASATRLLMFGMAVRDHGDPAGGDRAITGRRPTH